MSYGIVRIQKMTSSSVKGIEIHDRREKDGISHTNKDIDWDRSKDNYDLHQAQNANFNQAVKNRIDQLQLPRAVRKDAIVMAQALVTSDHQFFENLSPEKTRQFFEDSYKFFCDRYGKENVISATVHMDERTPHMHLNFVPVTEDGRLSARELFARANLRDLQDRHHEQVSRAYGLDRGERGSKAKHLDVIDYKLTTKAQELYEIATRSEGLQKNVDALEAKSQALEAKIDKNTEYITLESRLPRGKESAFGNKVILTQEEMKLLRETAMSFYKAKIYAQEQTAIADQLKSSTSYAHLQQLEQTVAGLRDELDASNKQAAKVPDLEQRCEKLQEQLQGFRDFYDDLQLNILERVSDKDRKWLDEAVIPKWAQPQFEKHMDALIKELTRKSPTHDLGAR